MDRNFAHISKTIKNLLGDQKDQFLEFAVNESMRDLESKASSFENYLVHRMALNSLQTWQSIVDETLKMMIHPFAEEAINDRLKRSFPKQLIGNSQLIDSVLESAASKIDMPVTRQLQCALLIQNLLPIMIGPRTSSMMKSIENKWQNHIVQIRTQIVLPVAFSNKNKNKNQALILSKKLWRIVGLFGTIGSLQFSSAYFIFMQALTQVQELQIASNSNLNEHSLYLSGEFQPRKDTGDDTIIQFALAFSECPLIITRFILINALIVKQDRFKLMASSDFDLILWSKLENSILLLLSSNQELMGEVLSFQEMLIDAKLV